MAFLLICSCKGVQARRGGGKVLLADIAAQPGGCSPWTRSGLAGKECDSGVDSHHGAKNPEKKYSHFHEL